MTTETKHTPLPWTLCRSTTDGQTVGFHFAGGKHGSRAPIIECRDFHMFTAEEMEANARLIDRAVHSHDQLVEALEKLTSFIDNEGPAAKEWKAISEWHEKAKSALAAAKAGA